MAKSLLEMSNSELLGMYKDYLKSEKARLEKRGGVFQFPADRVCTPLQPHDIWNAYDYGGGVLKVVYIKRSPKRKNAADCENERDTTKHYKSTSLKSDDERFSQSISRSKARIFELAMCNEFNFFCTFTQDEKLRDRFNLTKFRKDFAMLIRNLNRSRAEGEKIKYLLIPEQHKNGAWHMHGLLKGLTASDLREFRLSENIPERIKKQIRNGKKVYDWTRYRRAFGYFTCTDIENTTACSKYITKYISKDLQKTVREGGEHLFFASQGLNGRRVLTKNSFEPCPFDDWDFENDYVKIKEIKLSNPEK